MKIIRSYSFQAIIVVIIIFIFRNWFAKGILSASDFSLLFPLQLADYPWLPYSWSSIIGNGLGGSTFNQLYLDTYLHIGINFFVYTIHIPWNIAYRLIFYWPFLLVGASASYYLGMIILRNSKYASLAALIYMTNTYILMISTGGQVGLMLAYAITPALLGSYITKSFYIFSISVIAIILFDLRFSLLAFVIITIYTVVVIPRKFWREKAIFGAKSLLLALGFHSFWILPTVFSGGISLPEGYGNPDWLKFLSWADFSNSLSMLHPNWPENIFGKTYFMDPVFIIFPLIAFGGLLVRGNENKDPMTKSAISFGLILLCGAFMAKGVQGPFPEINRWIFEHIPLMNGFRDPTKYYIFITLAYSLLIPYALLNFQKRLHRYDSADIRRRFSGKVPMLFLILWIITILPILRTHPGTFGHTSIPQSYQMFADKMFAEKTFSRTFVVPWGNRFIYRSQNHPVVNASEVFGSTDFDKIVDNLLSGDFETILRSYDVQYVVIPDDVSEEIFVTDRQRDLAKRDAIIKALDTIPFLIKQKNQENLIIYEFTYRTDRVFTILNKHAYETYPNRRINPAHFEIDVTTTRRPLEIIFSEKYDRDWQLWDGEKIIRSKMTKYGLNRFVLDTDVTSQVTIYNSKQQWLNAGYTVSGIFIALLIIGAFIRMVYFRHGYRPRSINMVLMFIIGGIIGIGFTTNFRNISVLPGQSMVKIFLEMQRVSMDRVYAEEGIRLFQTGINDADNSYAIDFHSNTYRRCPAIVYGANVISRQRCLSGMKSCSILYSGPLYSKADNRYGSSGSVGVLGDSISVIFGKLNYTQLFSDWTNMELLNSSIMGSSVAVLPNRDSALLHYLNDIAKRKPDTAIIMMGTNDISENVDITVFAESYDKIVRGIRSESPHTQIITVGILPRNDRFKSKMLEYTSAIRNVAMKNSVVYINANSWLLNSDIPDGIHPSIEGQKRLASRLYDCYSMLQMKQEVAVKS